MVRRLHRMLGVIVAMSGFCDVRWCRHASDFSFPDPCYGLFDVRA
jgi:hypothetical protein